MKSETSGNDITTHWSRKPTCSYITCSSSTRKASTALRADQSLRISTYRSDSLRAVALTSAHDRRRLAGRGASRDPIHHWLGRECRGFCVAPARRSWLGRFPYCRYPGALEHLGCPVRGE